MNKNYNFYYGVDAKVPNNRYDYLTIMLHEVCHGLGFSAIIGQNGSYSYTPPTGPQQSTPYPGIYERQLFQGTDGPCLTELSQSQRAALLISNNLYAGAPGSHLLNANDGERIKMYAPTTYSSGSSTSHWDSSVTFPTFMKYSIGSGASNALHTFNDKKISLMQDIGWVLPKLNPNAFSVTFHPNGSEGVIVPQQFLPGVTKKLKPNTFKKEGYSPYKWNTLPNGSGTNYDERQLVNLTGDIDLYALWQANEYTLQLNPSGGTVEYNSKKVVFDAPIGELPIPVREGYIFEEWRIGATPINKETIWKYPENRQASAKWRVDNSIEETQNTTSLQIIPNPASHTIELRITNDALNQVQGRVDDIEFYNNLGQLVKNVPFERENIKDGKTVQNINISDLSAGVYIVKAGESAVKLVVQ